MQLQTDVQLTALDIILFWDTKTLGYRIRPADLKRLKWLRAQLPAEIENPVVRILTFCSVPANFDPDAFSPKK